MANGRYWFLIGMLSVVLTVVTLDETLLHKAELRGNYKWHDTTIAPGQYSASQSPSQNPINTGLCTSQPPAVPAQQNPPDIHEFQDVNLESYVTAIAWSPNGKFLASSEDNDRVIKIWSFPNLRLINTITKRLNGGGGIVFTKDSRFLITSYAGAMDHTNRSAFSVIDVNSGEIVRNVPGPYDPTDFPRANVPRDLRVSDDGKIVFVAFNNQDLKIYAYDTQNWKIIDSFLGRSITLETGLGAERLILVQIPLATQQPDDWLSLPDNIMAWNEKAKRFDLNYDFQTAKFIPNSLAIDEKQCVIAVGALGLYKATSSSPSGNISSVENGIRLWFPKSRKLFDLPSQPVIHSLSFTPDGLLLAAQSGSESDGKVNVLFLGELNRLKVYEMTINLFQDETISALFDPSGKYLALAGDRSIKILEVGK
jgi:WD40 repeat protein